MGHVLANFIFGDVQVGVSRRKNEIYLGKMRNYLMSRVRAKLNSLIALKNTALSDDLRPGLPLRLMVLTASDLTCRRSFPPWTLTSTGYYNELFKQKFWETLDSPGFWPDPRLAGKTYADRIPASRGPHTLTLTLNAKHQFSTLTLT